MPKKRGKTALMLVPVQYELPLSREEPRPAAPHPVESRTQHCTRSGTRREPYKRKRDGVETVKTSFCATTDFAARLREYTAGLPPELPRNEWMQWVIEMAMDGQLPGFGDP